MKSFKIVLTIFVALLFVVLTKPPVEAAKLPIIEVGEVRSLGYEVQVPITLYNTTYIQSLSATIKLPEERDGVTFKEFEPTGIFAGDQFNTIHRVDEKGLTIDFYSLSEKDITLKNEKTVIGYITYSLSPQFQEGESVTLEINQIRAKGRSNADLIFVPLNGKIDKRLPVGGVVSVDGPSAAGAVRILQHVDGVNPITEKEMILSADVDRNGKITQEDAQQILDYITGKQTSFLAIETVSLPDVAAYSEYSQKITATNGREPYEFKASGLPSGIKLDAKTGVLSGSTRTAKSYTVTVTVTDAVGNSAKRTFPIDVVDSNIISVEQIPTINVQLGGTPQLPSELAVTYKDKTKGRERVTWEDVDTSKLGETVIQGILGDTGFKVSVTINVVNTNYIDHIDVSYFQILNFYTITINVNPEVYAISINNINMHYESDNTFSLASSSLTPGSIVTIKCYDKFGNLLETKSHKLDSN